MLRCSDRANFFLNALVLYFYLEHVQRITFCRCFLIFNQAVCCDDDGVVLWLKIKNPTTTTISFVEVRLMVCLFLDKLIFNNKFLEFKQK